MAVFGKSVEDAEDVVADGGGVVRLADVRAAMAELRGKPLNGDGILVPAAAGDDAALKAYVEAAIAATDGKGKRGLFLVRYEESDALSAAQTVKITLDGIDGLYNVYAYMTDKDRTMQRYNINFFNNTFSVDLLPNSFIYIEY